jgi:hypothetical protein
LEDQGIKCRARYWQYPCKIKKKAKA